MTSISAWPETSHLALEQRGPFLHVTLNRPEVANAMSKQMVFELLQVADAIADDRSVRAVIFRGAGKHFSAGADLKDMVEARAQAESEGAVAWQKFNRSFGAMLQRLDQLPQVTIAVIQGAAIGGGFGLACISDVAIALDTAKFSMPETTRGILPAQIAPFVVDRIGLTQARRLTLLGSKIEAPEAQTLGIVHYVESSPLAVEMRLTAVLDQLKLCAPIANANTKRLLHLTRSQPLGSVLDEAAVLFSQAVTSEEGAEGTLAFIEKRPPAWAKD